MGPDVRCGVQVKQIPYGPMRFLGPAAFLVNTGLQEMRPGIIWIKGDGRARLLTVIIQDYQPLLYAPAMSLDGGKTLAPQPPLPGDYSGLAYRR